MIEYISLLLAIPLGLLLSKLTKHEKNIYSQKIYFPTIQKLLLILAAITIFLNQQLFLTSTFMLITIHFWNRT